MLETYMIYFIPISCIHNNLLNTFKSENGSLFYFILFYVMCLLYLNYVLKKKYVLKITYQTPLNMKMYYYYYFFYIQDLNVK